MIKLHNSAVRVAAQMPLLPHHVRGHAFDIMESAVCAWLCDQPEIRQAIFNWAKGKTAIVLDLESGCWRGAAWADVTTAFLFSAFIGSFARIGATSGEGVSGLGKLAGETFVRWTCRCGNNGSRAPGLLIPVDVWPAFRARSRPEQGVAFAALISDSLRALSNEDSKIPS